MSVDQIPAEKARRSAPEAKLVGYDEYIDTQIRHTRRMVKVVDLATALAVLATGALGYLLISAVVENWLVPGGFGTLERSLILGVMVVIAGQYAYRRIWPLLVRPINPVYAAQAIEQSSPSLKNSLLNLLLFRQRREQITDAVYETLEEQAAHGLTRVPVDSAVDRTHLIRFGYALVAVVSLCALYKMFSPKDPLIAVQRVLMPWADIVPASRVAITDVKPGTTTLARGEMLPVTADVTGVGENDPVVVRYTTADGQAVEKAVTMKASESGLHFTAQLPAAAEPGRPTGVSQNLRYQIEAGDARSHVYSVTVIAAPTITVERVDYAYPAYTGSTNHSVDGLGDIRAIEGTRVTIHARANAPIKEAAIDFEADGRRDIRMTVDGSEALASFVLGLRDDHQTPKYKTYAVRFTGTDDATNRDPVKYPIDVLADQSPEASILAPAEKVRQVRLDETVAIAIEARDPDFALSEVRLKGDVGGRMVLDEPLLNKPRTGRFTGRMQFTAIDQGLKAGDVMQYWVVAHDNRTPQPNEAASERQTLQIGSPDPNQPRPDRIAQRENRPQQPGEQERGQKQQGDVQGKEQQQPADGSQGSGGGQQGGGQPPAGATSREPQNGQQSGDKPQGDQSKGDKSEKSQSKDGSSSGKQQGGGQSQQEKQDKQSKQGQGKDSQQQQPGGSESGGGHDKSQKQPGQSSSGGGESGDNNSQSGQSGADQNTSGKQGGSKGGEQHRNSGDGKSSSPNDQKDSNGGAGGKGGHENVKPSDSPSQVSPEGDNDGEAFDRIQKFLQRSGELRDPSGSQKKPQGGQQSSGENQNGNQGPTGQNQAGNDKSASGRQSQSDGKPGDQKQPAQERKPPSDSKNAAGNRGDQNQDAPKGDQQSKEGAKDGQGEKQSGKDAGGKDKDTGSQENSGDKQGSQQKPNGQPAQSTGESGGGQPSQKEQASPDSGQQPKSSEKWQQTPSKTDDKKSDGGSEPPSGGESKRKSDSQGDEGGDKAGGGKQGGGQQSPHEGTGSGGQNQSADEGTGESSEHGKGHESSSGGKDAQAKGKTGQSGSNEPGNGSTQRDGQGDQPGGKPNDGSQSSGEKSGDKSGDKSSSENKPTSGSAANHPSDGKSAASDRSDNKPNDANQNGANQSGTNQDGAKNGEGNQSKNTQGNQSSNQDNKDKQSQQKSDSKSGESSNKGGNSSASDAGQNSDAKSGQSGGNNGPSSSNGTPGAPQGAGGSNKTDATAAEGDEANLEYARKQTDLVLETLSDQMKHKKVDKRLLDELGWSEQDLQKFLARWQQLKETAKGDTPAADAAQKELDDALRSLGLHRGPMQQGKVTEDKVRDLHEGYHGPVPLEYQERLRAYNQGVSRARKDGE
jgi:hypothetical protein